jgi:hypothetical protein
MIRIIKGQFAPDAEESCPFAEVRVFFYLDLLNGYCINDQAKSTKHTAIREEI